MSQLYIEISNDPKIWDKFNLCSPQSNPFQSYEWLRTYSKIFNLSQNIVFVKRGEEVISGLIYASKRKIFFDVSTPLPFSYYSGVMFRSFKGQKIQKEIVEKNEAILKIHRHLIENLDFFIMKLHYTVVDIRQFRWLGYSVKPRHTFILDISSLESLWDRFNNSLRRKIRDAQEKGFIVVRTNDVTNLAEQQILSLERSGKKFFVEFDTLKKLLEDLVEKNLLIVYHLIDKNNQVLSSRGVSVWNGKAYDVVAGMLEKNVGNSSHFLMWKIFEDLASNGVKEFDFCGADIESVAFFKMQFGGEIKVSFEVSYAKGILKLLSQVRR